MDATQSVKSWQKKKGERTRKGYRSEGPVSAGLRMSKSCRWL